VLASEGERMSPYGRMHHQLRSSVGTLAGLVLLCGCTKPVIEGTVVRMGGVPVVGAEVKIEGTTLATTTDSSGHYRISFVPGQFKVTASKEGLFSDHLEFNITQAAEVPAQAITLYPRIDRAALYAVHGDEFDALPTQPVAMSGNLISSVSGVKEVADAPQLEPGTRVFRQPATGQPVRLARLEYEAARQFDGVFGKQTGQVDMWIEQNALQVPVDSRGDGAIEELLLPKGLEPGVYAVGDATAAQSPIEAATGGHDAVIVVHGDPDKFFLGDIDPEAPSAVKDTKAEWSESEDPEKTFKETGRFELGPTKEEFAISCNKEQCGASNCFHECRVDHLASGNTVLKLGDEETFARLYPTLSQNVLFWMDEIWRMSISDECHACPHHRIYRRYDWDAAQRRFSSPRPHASPRRYHGNGPIPSTWNGVLRLDDEMTIDGVKLGTAEQSVPGLVPAAGANPEGCLTKPGEPPKFGKSDLEQILYCFRNGVLASVVVKSKQFSPLLGELQSRYGMGFERQAPDRVRTWRGKRVELRYETSADWKEQTATLSAVKE
jgi:hypothetical protein